MPRHILIVGASRGIGLGLVREFTGRGWRVTATVRGPAPELESTGATIEQVDMADGASIDALAARIEAPIDVLLVNAGITGPRHQSVQRVTPQELGEHMFVNAAAPLRLAHALLGRVPDDGTVAFMTSQLGSVADATTAMAELYRASKAALNMFTRTFAAEAAGSRTVLSLHPGWVRTDMGGEQAPLEVPESARGLADVIEGTTGPGHSYLDYQGKTLPW